MTASDPSDLVTEFCAKWAEPEAEDLARYFTRDGVYHNIPLDPVVGPPAIQAYLGGSFNDLIDGVDFIVHRQVHSGSIVMNERTDVMRFKNGSELRLPVMGIFEISDGKIAAWRDYFDLATVSAAFELAGQVA